MALQPDQPRAAGVRERARHLGLADARLALQQQRLLERGRQVHARGERPVGQVALAGERAGDVLRRAELHVQQCDAWRGSTRAPDRSTVPPVPTSSGGPGWPPEAVEIAARRLGLEADAAVLDLAAGTGKLTRLLAGRFASVTAVEPLPGMRAVLEAQVPGALALAGTAEEIPLAGRIARRRVRRGGLPLVRPRSPRWPSSRASCARAAGSPCSTTGSTGRTPRARGARRPATSSTATGSRPTRSTRTTRQPWRAALAAIGELRDDAVEGHVQRLGPAGHRGDVRVLQRPRRRSRPSAATSRSPRSAACSSATGCARSSSATAPRSRPHAVSCGGSAPPRAAGGPCARSPREPGPGTMPSWRSRPLRS